jgi:hypothetical protein
MSSPRPIFPLSVAEFIACTFGTALTIYVVGLVMGVQWFG